MKIIFSLSMLGLLLAQCTRDARTPHTRPFEATATLAARQTARLTAEATPTVTADSVQDSRCPANAMCVWQGNARVRFTLRQGTATQGGTLCLGDCTGGPRTADTTRLQLDGQLYTVILQKVEPYPGTTDPQQPPRATLLVQQQNP